ncbi:MAG: TonB-dependent receptor, partial [Sphingobacteriales bacterium]
SDIQRNQNIVDNSTNPPGILGLVLNAAKARIQGVEIEATVKPIAALTLTGLYSYLDARYREYSFAGVDLEGVRLPFTPKHKASVTARFDLPVPDGLGQPYIFASYAYNSSFRWNDLDLPGNTVVGYGLIDMSAGWDDIGGSRLSATAFVTNLSNKLYRQISSVQYASVGISSAIYSEPRMYGLRLRYAFD